MNFDDEQHEYLDRTEWGQNSNESDSYDGDTAQIEEDTVKTEQIEKAKEKARKEKE